jgi:membrane protease YdiL (CAAX protease family)
MMEQLAKDPWIQAVGTVILVTGIVPWIVVILRKRRNREILRYEPRRPVPWGIAGAFLAVAFTALTIATALTVGDASQHVSSISEQEMSSRLLGSMVTQLCGPVLLLLIALSCNASRSDVGLPPFSASAIARDVSIGIVACMAAIIPVRLVQLALASILQLPDEITKQPMVQMLITSQPDVLTLALATCMVVVIAPICEEITFRLLLQGWLEKWEDRQLGWRLSPVDELETCETADPTGDCEAALGSTQEIDVIRPPAAEPPQRGVAGLPYGWTPIILSSLLFAAAHFGYGPEPVPLFVLALVLGYCYQRTHRIVPCIVAHALFNLLSMIVLWRVVLIHAAE